MKAFLTLFLACGLGLTTAAADNCPTTAEAEAYSRTLNFDHIGRAVPVKTWLNAYYCLQTPLATEVSKEPSIVHEVYSYEGERDGFADVVRYGDIFEAGGYSNGMGSVSRSEKGYWLATDVAAEIASSCEAFAERHPSRKAAIRQLADSLSRFDRTATGRKPFFFAEVRRDYRGDFEAYLKRVYRKSMITNEGKRRRFLRAPNVADLKKDPGVMLALDLALYEVWMKRQNAGK